jgi:DNA-binding transcriptional LysR family regulator
MDIAAARTFLAIVEAGNFVSASRRLNVTQSTVSARIRTLEDSFGKPLFIRTKASCELTSAGRRFYRHARTIVRAWEEARHQLAVPADYDDHLAIGGQYSLWNHYLLSWLLKVSAAYPKCSVHASVGMPDRLMQQLIDGVLDLAVMYDPQYRPGLVVEKMFDDALILVSGGDDVDMSPQSHVFVDWGEDFRHWHAAHFDDWRMPGLTLALGSIGVGYLIDAKKSGYFPKRIAAPYIESGALRPIEAPVFDYPVFAVYQAGGDAVGLIKSLLGELQELTA